MTGRHFSSIDDLIEWVERDLVSAGMREMFPLHANYEYLWSSEGTLVPSPCSSFASPFLYRGQVERYQPCITSVFRGLDPESDFSLGWKGLSKRDRARLFIERVRLEEFVLALLDHPARGYAKEIGLRLNPIGLAQHYEMATDRLDLTQDHGVAAFFATNRCVDNEWVPVSEGVGVVYRVRTSLLDEVSPSRLECLGKQSLPRPGEQKAFTLTLPLSYDFERLPTEVLTFDQVGTCSLRLNGDYYGGASLFPPDVMADIAASIRSEHSIPRGVADWLLSHGDPALEYLGEDAGEFEALIERYSEVRVSGRERLTLTRSQHEQATSSLEETKLTFLDNVGAIAVRRAPE